MNSKRILFLFAVVSCLPLASCSGLHSGCSTGCTTGDANVTITLFDTPPAGVTVLSFSLPIVGISLTPSSGSPVSISPTSVVPKELTRLQTDSTTVVTAAKVPAGTYTSINVTLGPSSGVFVNANPNHSTITGSGNVSCVFGQVCNLPAGAAATVNIPLSLTLTNNQNQWIGLDVNLNNAIITTNTTVISVDFTQPKVFTATTTPRTGIPAGSVDIVEDFTGKITAVSSSSITVQSGMTGESITATLNSNTELASVPAVYSNCTSVATCLTTGTTVSLDALLSSAGTYTATEIDALDATATPTDEVEGVIYPTSTAGVVGMILADKSSKTGNAVLSAATTTFGTGIFLTLSTSANFVIDPKTLSSNPNFVPIGFSGTGNLLAGQQVRVQVSGVASGTSGITGTANNVALRFSRISGTIATVSGSAFTITGYPSYLSLLNPALGATPLVYSYSPGTLFDGVTGTGDPKFVTGATIAIRALYLDNAQPTFASTKVRVP
jgi:hypothetical protein